MPIQRLPPEVIAQIAAGEVIDSPLAAIRELVENALDAAAQRITLTLDWDRGRFEVIDDGQGIAPEDLAASLAPHSTSKIHSLEDLQQIQSLGFRGEALHSLTQVATVTLASCLPGDSGWAIHSDPGQPPRIGDRHPLAMAPGTRVTVQRLFEPWPARRQALPPIPRQRQQLQRWLQIIALCHPHVAWQVQQGGKRLIHWPAVAAPSDRLRQIQTHLQGGDLGGGETPLALPSGIPEKAIAQWVLGYPDRCHRPRPDGVLLGLNGRGIQQPELIQAIQGVFHRSLPPRRHPLCFVHLHLPPACIDWHRHPAKGAVYLHHLDHWCAQVTTILQTQMQQIPQAETAPAFLLYERLRAQEPLSVYKTKTLPQTSVASPIPSPAPRSSQGKLTSSLRPLAQVLNTYILAESDRGIWLVEQHVAHERILFEEIQDRWTWGDLPEPLLLTRLTAPQIAHLTAQGFTPEPFGPHTYRLDRLPQALIADPDRLTLIQAIARGGNLEQAQVNLACRQAVRNGIPLDPPTYGEILTRWQNCRQPHTCPHGRPIYFSLSEDQLAQFFRRNWRSQMKP